WTCASMNPIAVNLRGEGRERSAAELVPEIVLARRPNAAQNRPLPPRCPSQGQAVSAPSSGAPQRRPRAGGAGGRQSSHFSLARFVAPTVTLPFTTSVVRKLNRREAAHDAQAPSRCRGFLFDASGSRGAAGPVFPQRGTDPGLPTLYPAAAGGGLPRSAE